MSSTLAAMAAPDHESDPEPTRFLPWADGMACPTCLSYGTVCAPVRGAMGGWSPYVCIRCRATFRMN